MRIKKCNKCGKYTMKNSCCEKTLTAHPPQFSIDDKYGKYRRIARSE